MIFRRSTAVFLTAVMAGTVMCGVYPLHTAAADSDYENVLQNCDFENTDSYGFPIDWSSDGQNLLQNGDFESGSFDMGYNYEGSTRLKWAQLGGSAISLENEENPYGKYHAKILWNESKWGGIGVRNDAGMYPLSYGGEYIYRGTYKLIDNPFPANTKTQFNTIFYTSDTDYTERVVNILAQPDDTWKEVSYNYSIREKQDSDVYEYPKFTRWQFRITTGAVGEGIYADNLRMEKLGRTDETEKSGGERSLKIVAYNDGVDEVWRSKSMPSPQKGREIIFGGMVKLSDTSLDASIRLNYYDEQGNCVLSDEKAVENAGTDWQLCEFRSTAPGNAQTVSMELVLKGAEGTAWFDNCFINIRKEAVSAAANKYALWYKSNYASLFKGDAHIRAAVAARYYRYFGTSKYLNDAINSYREMMAGWADNSSKISSLADDFFSGSYVIETYIMLRDMGYTTDEEEALMLKYISSFFRPSLKESHNQVMARAEAMAYAVKAFPDRPETGSWQEWLDMYWNILDNDKDIQEDAGDYNGIAMRDMIRWLDVTNQERKLLDDGWKEMFLRYLHQQAPNGSMPEYGDDFYGRTLDWIYIFEYLANLYGSPEFAYGARKAFDWGTKNAPSGYCMNSETLELLKRLYTGEEKKPLLTSEITSRRLVGGIPSRNKILLRNEKGFVWIDNTYYLSHSHRNSKGAITYYEYDSVPLFHSLERRFIDARFQNRMAMLNSDEPFPFNDVAGNQMNPGRAATNTWYHDELSLENLPESDDENPNIRDLDRLCLRLSKERNNHVNFIIDNVRLEGPGGTYMLYDFENGTTGKFKYSNCTNIEGGYQSNRAMQVRVDSSNVFYIASQKLKFDITKYNCLKWDWKTTTDDNADMTWLWFVMRVYDDNCNPEKVKEANLGGTTCYVETSPGELATYTTDIVDAIVEDRDKDSYAELELCDFFGTGSTQKRRIALTEEGYLIIQDTIYPTEAADGKRAGAIWNLYNISERGSNWFLQSGEKKWYTGMSDSSGKSNGLFVMFSDSSDAQIDSVSAVSGTYTQSSSRIVRAGVPQSFITVVAPNINDSKTGEELASSIKILKDGVYESGVSYKIDSGWVHVEFPKDGSFNITRGVSGFAYEPQITQTENEIHVKGAFFGTAKPVLALYENGILKQVKMDFEEEAYGDYTEFSMSLEQPDGNYSAKAFVWDEMKPLAKAVNFGG